MEMFKIKRKTKGAKKANLKSKSLDSSDFLLEEAYGETACFVPLHCSNLELNRDFWHTK